MLLRLEVLDLAGEFWDSGSLLSSDALAEHVILLLNVKAVTIYHIKDQLLQLYPYLRLYYFLRFDSSVNKQVRMHFSRLLGRMPKLDLYADCPQRQWCNCGLPTGTKYAPAGDLDANRCPCAECALSTGYHRNTHGFG
jgi:hypothetical protein